MRSRPRRPQGVNVQGHGVRIYVYVTEGCAGALAALGHERSRAWLSFFSRAPALVDRDTCAGAHIPPAGNGVCFNPRELFPADKQWGLYDTRDVCNMTHITRSFFASTNATCVNQTGFVTLAP